MIALDPFPAHPFRSVLEGAILDADPSCARHVAAAAARAAADYLGEQGFHSTAPSTFMGVVLARCLDGIGMRGAASAVLEAAEPHPFRRTWWRHLAGALDFDPVIWHAMDRSILRPASWQSVPESTPAWRLDLRRMRAGGMDWSELAWFPSLRRLLEALCACEARSAGAFRLAVSGVTGTLAAESAEYCRQVLRREAVNRDWPAPPTVWIEGDFTPRRTGDARPRGLPPRRRKSF